MKRSRALALLLAAVMTIGCLAGCGSGSGSTSSGGNTSRGFSGRKAEEAPRED